MKKARPPKPAKSESAWRLFAASLKDFRVHWKRYVMILAIVAIPSYVLSLNSALASDAGFNAYASFAAIIMNVALLWAIVQHQKHGPVPTIATAYYEGSASLVRYILVTTLIVAMLLPFGLGVALYDASLVTPGLAGSFGTEQLLVGSVALLVSLPSGFLLVRLGLGSVIVVHDGLRPIAALRRSWHITKRRFWPVAGRFVMLGVFLALTSIPTSVITVILSVLGAGAWSGIFFEFATTLLVLPILNLYLLNLYHSLASTLPTPREQE